jgi:hypothetical protein
MMSEFSSWGLIEPDVEPPKIVKKTIQKNVMAQLTMARFIGNIVDLYVGKVGQTIIGLAETFDDDGAVKYQSHDDK